MCSAGNSRCSAVCRTGGAGGLVCGQSRRAAANQQKSGLPTEPIPEHLAVPRSGDHQSSERAGAQPVLSVAARHQPVRDHGSALPVAAALSAVHWRQRADANQGYSWYHSMQTRFEKRFSAGFTRSVSWTWSKLMEARSYLNGGDPMPEQVISDQDRTHRFVVTAIYELPFGKGKRLGRSWHGFASKIISGWQASGIYQGQSGAPLGFGNAIFLGNLQDIPIANGAANCGPLVQYRCGIRAEFRVATEPKPAHPELPFLRNPPGWSQQPGRRDHQEYAAQGGVQLQLRFEGINALNHAQFNRPNTDAQQQRVRTGDGHFCLAADRSVGGKDSFLTEYKTTKRRYRMRFLLVVTGLLSLRPWRPPPMARRRSLS